MGVGQGRGGSRWQGSIGQGRGDSGWQGSIEEGRGDSSWQGGSGQPQEAGAAADGRRWESCKPPFSGATALHL